MTVQLRLGLSTSPALGGGDFVEAASNTEALARLSDWTAWSAGALALFGPSGVGKTHLGRLWAKAADARPADALLAEPALLTSGAAVWLDMADTRLAEPETAELVFHLINRAGRGEGALLLAGREAPAAWSTPMPDLRSRLNALATAEVGEPDDALLHRLLVKFFRERSIRPSPELLAYLVRRMDRSARGAAAIVEALDAACRGGARLGRALARELLHDPGDDPGYDPGDENGDDPGDDPGDENGAPRG